MDDSDGKLEAVNCCSCEADDENSHDYMNYSLYRVDYSRDLIAIVLYLNSPAALHLENLASLIISLRNHSLA